MNCDPRFRAFSSDQHEWLRRNELRSLCAISPVILGLYRVRRLRGLCLRLAGMLESGPFFSQTVRAILEQHHGARIGRYSYGSILKPGTLPPGSVVGTYCSVGANLIVRRRNHPTDRLTQHPLFYNSGVGVVEADTVKAEKDNPLTIGNDVWIGDNVIILPRCTCIGDGAVIGAGSVVTRDVEAYTIVTGSPARMLRHRYDKDIELLVRASRWWELPAHELLQAGELLVSPIELREMERFCRSIRPCCEEHRARSE